MKITCSLACSFEHVYNFVMNLVDHFIEDRKINRVYDNMRMTHASVVWISRDPLPRSSAEWITGYWCATLPQRSPYPCVASSHRTVWTVSWTFKTLLCVSVFNMVHMCFWDYDDLVLTHRFCSYWTIFIIICSFK